MNHHCQRIASPTIGILIALVMTACSPLTKKPPNSYREGKKQGWWIEHREKGFSVLRYKQGKRNGPCWFFDETNELIRMQTYKSDSLHGKMLRYDAKGKVYFKRNYRRGKVHGWQVSYSEKGKVGNKALFRNGKFIRGQTNNLGWD